MKIAPPLNVQIGIVLHQGSGMYHAPGSAGSLQN